jgi:hypothetical protein
MLLNIIPILAFLLLLAFLMPLLPAAAVNSDVKGVSAVNGLTVVVGFNIFTSVPALLVALLGGGSVADPVLNSAFDI